jgi:hypothetical protein
MFSSFTGFFLNDTHDYLSTKVMLFPITQNTKKVSSPPTRLGTLAITGGSLLQGI